MSGSTDTAAFLALIVLFALAVTVHVAVSLGLATRSPRWHAAAALIVPPLAPYWAFRERMMVRGAAWIVVVVGYAVATVVLAR